MKTQSRIAIWAVILLTFAGGVACSNSSGSSGSSSADAVITITPNPLEVAASQTEPITISGGTGTFTLALNTTIGGQLSQYSAVAINGIAVTSFTAGSTAGAVTLTVTDSDNQVVTVPITITGGTTGGTLTINPPSTTLAPNGSTTFIASGGTGIYNFQVISGGGTISTSGSTAFYTAPATSGISVEIEVTDTANNVGTATVFISGTSTTSGCQGTYSAFLDGYPASLVIGPNDGSGNFIGYLTIDGFQAIVQGACLNGTISFTDEYSGSPYSCPYFVSGTTTVMAGPTCTFTYGGQSFPWTATN